MYNHWWPSSLLPPENTCETGDAALCVIDVCKVYILWQGHHMFISLLKNDWCVFDTLNIEYFED